MSGRVGLLLGPRLASVGDPLEADALGGLVVSVAEEAEPAADTLIRVRSVCQQGAEILLVVDDAHSLGPETASAQSPCFLIADHLNLTGTNPLVGANAAEWGPRFQDLTDAWDPVLRSMLRATGLKAGFDLREGIVAGMAGESHTAAEASMLRILGADLVSSGFVAEAISGRHAGRRMAGIAVTSDDVIESAGFRDLLPALVASLTES